MLPGGKLNPMEVTDVGGSTRAPSEVETDVFNWQVAIGDFREEYDAQQQTMVNVFRRTPDVQLAIKRVNKCAARGSRRR